MEKQEFVRRVYGCERRLYRVARTMLRSEADCEDAVQEALIRAWSRLTTLRQPEFFETWLIRILINECRAVYRRRKPEVELSESIPIPEKEDSGLLEALMALPEKLRITTELHYIEGYSMKEMASILHVPEGTVKWRLKKARDVLREQLDKEGLL